MRGYPTGATVLIADVRHRPDNYADLEGKIGIVERTYFQNGPPRYAVRVPGATNKNAASGLFWFMGKNLKPSTKELKEEEINCEEEKETIEMANKYKLAPGAQILAAVKCNANKTSVDRENPQPFLVACYRDDIEIGDIVLLGTTLRGGDLSSVTLGRLTGPDPEMYTAYKEGDYTVKFEVIGAVDDTAYLDRRNKVETAAKLLDDMKREALAAQELSLYETLAERDPKMRDLLRKYKALTETPEVIA